MGVGDGPAVAEVAVGVAPFTPAVGVAVPSGVTDGVPDPTLVGTEVIVALPFGEAIAPIVTEASGGCVTGEAGVGVAKFPVEAFPSRVAVAKGLGVGTPSAIAAGSDAVGSCSPGSGVNSIDALKGFGDKMFFN